MLPTRVPSLFDNDSLLEAPRIDRRWRETVAVGSDLDGEAEARVQIRHFTDIVTIGV